MSSRPKGYTDEQWSQFYAMRSRVNQGQQNTHNPQFAMNSNQAQPNINRSNNNNTQQTYPNHQQFAAMNQARQTQSNTNNYAQQTYPNPHLAMNPHQAQSMNNMHQHQSISQTGSNTVNILIDCKPKLFQTAPFYANRCKLWPVG